jgi:hypothetical protein
MSKIDSGALKSVSGNYQDPLAVLEDGEHLKSIICGAYSSTIRLGCSVAGDIEVELCSVSECNRYIFD